MKRKLTRRQIAGMRRNWVFRVSPAELRARLGADRPVKEPSHFELDGEDLLQARAEADCPAFDDMSGNE